MPQSTTSLDQNANRVNDAHQAVRFFKVVLSNQELLAEGTLEDASLDLGAPCVASLLLDVTEIDGSPELDVDVETSADGSTWETVDSFPQLTSVDSARLRVVVDRYIRAKCVVGGTATPKVTFTITGEAK